MATPTAITPQGEKRPLLAIEDVLALNGHKITAEERRAAVDSINIQYMHRGVFMLDFDIVTGEPLIGVARIADYANAWGQDAVSTCFGKMPVTTKRLVGWMGQPVEVPGRWLRVFRFPPSFMEGPHESAWMGVLNAGPNFNNYGFFVQNGDDPLRADGWFYDFTELHRWVQQVCTHTTRPHFMPTRDKVLERLAAYKKNPYA